MGLVAEAGADTFVAGSAIFNTNDYAAPLRLRSKFLSLFFYSIYQHIKADEILLKTI